MEITMKMITEAFWRVYQRQPEAFAYVKGSGRFPLIRGLVRFYAWESGTIVIVDLSGLPRGNEPCGGRFFGFHIHEGSICKESQQEPFADVKGHWNPRDCSHPFHAGDMPVLEGAGDRAWMAFYTERFRPGQVRGHTVIVHDMPDDYRSQPAGDSGEKIACGQIV